MTLAKKDLAILEKFEFVQPVGVKFLAKQPDKVPYARCLKRRRKGMPFMLI